MSTDFGKGGAPWWMWALMLIAVVMAFNPRFGDKLDQAVRSSGVAAVAEQPEPYSPAWQYGREVDAMSSGQVSSAWMESRNEISFGFPYEGLQRGSLQLRKHPRYGTDVIFFVQKGQINLRYDGIIVLVRFDDGPAMQFTAFESGDHDRTTMFIRGYKRFSEKLRSASVVKIEVPFYRDGPRVFEFDASSFDDSWL